MKFKEYQRIKVFFSGISYGFLLFFYITADAQVNTTKIERANLEITKISILQVTGKLTKGNSGITYNSEILPKTKIIKTSIKTFRGVELVSMETPLLDTLDRLTSLHFFNDEISFSYTEKKMLKEKLASGITTNGQLNIYLKNKSKEYPEIRLIPQLSVALGLLGFKGNLYPAVMQIHRIGLKFATIAYDIIDNRTYSRFNTNTAKSKNLKFARLLNSSSEEKNKVRKTNSIGIGIYGSFGVNPIVINAKFIDPRIKLEKLQTEPCYCYFSTMAPPEIIKAQEELCDYIQQTCNPDNLGCEAYPNPENECFGMCGAGCDCWSWICGDCCYHTFCAEHDEACGGDLDYAGCVLVLPGIPVCSSTGFTGLINDIIDLF